MAADRRSVVGGPAAPVRSGDTPVSVDEVITRTGVDVPPAEPDDADVPVDLDPCCAWSECWES